MLAGIKNGREKMLQFRFILQKKKDYLCPLLRILWLILALFQEWIPCGLYPHDSISNRWLMIRKYSAVGSRSGMRIRTREMVYSGEHLISVLQLSIAWGKELIFLVKMLKLFRLFYSEFFHIIFTLDRCLDLCNPQFIFLNRQIENKPAALL